MLTMFSPLLLTLSHADKPLPLFVLHFIRVETIITTIQEAMAGGSERATEMFEEEFGRAIAVKAAEKKSTAKAAPVKANVSQGVSEGDKKR